MESRAPCEKVTQVSRPEPKAFSQLRDKANRIRAAPLPSLKCCRDHSDVKKGHDRKWPRLTLKPNKWCGDAHFVCIATHLCLKSSDHATLGHVCLAV
jgi:hypothetical protein